MFPQMLSTIQDFQKRKHESIKINDVSAFAFVNIVCGDSEAVIWCTLVRPVVN